VTWYVYLRFNLLNEYNDHMIPLCCLFRQATTKDGETVAWTLINALTRDITDTRWVLQLVVQHAACPVRTDCLSS